MFKNAKINLLIASLFSVTAYAADLTTQKIQVISNTPLAGVGQPINEIPFTVQTSSDKDIRQTQALNISDFLNENMTGVYVNNNGGNPFGVDLSYRGFTASPILGTPQGLSVFMDGVRMNQPFGDTVLWELIPTGAIKNTSLISGSNPV